MALGFIRLHIMQRVFFVASLILLLGECGGAWDLMTIIWFIGERGSHWNSIGSGGSGARRGTHTHVRMTHS